MALWITTAKVRSLIEIASAACQRPIRCGVIAATGERYDVFDLQREVEHGFWGMTILTTMTCLECHLGIVGFIAPRYWQVQQPAPPMHAIPRQ